MVNWWNGELVKWWIGEFAQSYKRLIVLTSKCACKNIKCKNLNKNLTEFQAEIIPDSGNSPFHYSAVSPFHQFTNSPFHQFTISPIHQFTNYTNYTNSPVTPVSPLPIGDWWNGEIISPLWFNFTSIYTYDQ